MHLCNYVGKVNYSMLSANCYYTEVLQVKLSNIIFYLLSTEVESYPARI